MKLPIACKNIEVEGFVLKTDMILPPTAHAVAAPIIAIKPKMNGGYYLLEKNQFLNIFAFLRKNWPFPGKISPK